MEDFDFEIKYRPGIENGRADALSRRADYADDAVGTAQVAVVDTVTTPTEPAAPAVQDTAETTPTVATVTTVLTSVDDLHQRIIKAQQEDFQTRTLIDDVQQHPREGIFTLEDGALMKSKRLFVPDQNALKLEVLKRCHDATSAGHMGFMKTVTLVTRHYYWPGMWTTVKDYVATCDVCQRAKSSKRGAWGELHQLQIPEAPWTDISMDFIVKLPPSQTFDSILVVVDRLTKMTHLIACNETADAAALATMFVKEIVRLHGMPKTIVSDRGSTFMSKFWERTCELWGVHLKHSTAYHPQTDGQTDRTNQTTEQYLRMYADYEQDDWAAHLPMAEFAMNNARHESTGMSPFEANGGAVHWIQDGCGDQTEKVPAAEQRLSEMRDVMSRLKEHLEKAQERQKRQYDKTHTPSPIFEVGDLVWLRTDNIRTKRPSKKLDDRRTGPFPIMRRIGDVTYQLKLDDTMRIHDVFHVDRLDKVTSRTSTLREGEQQPGSAPVITDPDGDRMYAVKDIVDSRTVDGELQYKIDWEGYSKDEQSWEPASSVSHLTRLVRTFHKANPKKPKRTKKSKEKSKVA